MNEIKSFFTELINSKKGRIALLLVCIGALLCLTASFTSGGEGSNETSNDLYKQTLEGELAELCSSIDGVGKCKIMIYFDEGERSEYKNGRLVSTHPPKIRGITVLCRGGGRDEVKGALTEMLSSMLGIGKNRICVLKLS